MRVRKHYLTAYVFQHNFIILISLLQSHYVMGVLPYPQLRLYAGSRKDSCQTGQYYHKDTNGSGKCRKCFVCPKGYTEHLPCSKTTNRSCKPCEIGTSFSDKRGGICRNCTECERGQFIRRQCLPYKDTRCKTCPKGTYSLDGESFGCKFCSVCKEHEEEVSLCTPLQNRVCRLKEEDYSNITNPWDSGIPEYSTDFNFATRLVLIALLIFISCTFVIFLFATVLQTISTRFPSVKCFFII
ncbi:tumor necrosis factor receptor superfamily member 16-like [Mya arenaria]|uniref:tumor necrosis factor receptor superfamily member 16-like n=1 Tax=Mya arenaria TaxID=6604 RepID=UPI0022E86075|nr:tumor necrosis factor receptor superfamily member 16-like [Mya arenaria]